MKNVIYLIGLTILMSSCGNTDNVTIPKDEYNKLKGVPVPIKPEYPKRLKINDGFNNPICNIVESDSLCNIVESDSCEYISLWLGTNGGVFTHKGNCKFCQHRLEETIRKIIREELQKK